MGAGASEEGQMNRYSKKITFAPGMQGQEIAETLKTPRPISAHLSCG